MNNSIFFVLPCHRKRPMLMAVSCCVFISSLLNINHAAAATITNIIEVNIVSNINLVAETGIEFGDISSSAIPGTVTIGTDSSRITTGGVTVNTNTSGTPALYEVSGDPNATYSVTLPDSVVLTSGAGDHMVVDKFTSIPNNNGQLDSSGRQKVNVGGTLHVDSFQPFGAYQGIMSTTVDYD